MTQLAEPSAAQSAALADIRARWRALPRLLGLLWEVGSRDTLIMVVGSLMVGLAPLLIVISVQRLVDAAVAVLQGQASLRLALAWAAALFAANLLQGLLEAANRWLGEVTQERLKIRIQVRVLHKASRLALAKFEHTAVYDQLHRAQRGLDSRLFSTIQQLIPVPASLVTLIVMLGYLAQGHALLPIVLLLGIVPSALWSTRAFGKQYLLERQHTHAERRLRYFTQVMTERPAAAEIRLFGLQRHLLDAWSQSHRDLCADRLRLRRAEALGLVLRTVLERLAYGLVIAGVVALIVAGRISLGAFTSYLAAMDQFTGAIYGLLWNLALTDGDLRYIHDLLEFLDQPEENPAARRLEASLPVVASRPAFSGVAERTPTIDFESVSFRYPGAEQPVLSNLSFTLRQGERIALVGENGAGKTTLAKLLLGLYTPSAGRILVDGTDLRDVDATWWRSQAVAVFQDYVRYAVTARENIGFGDLARLADRPALRAAAVRSGADAVAARLPQGYNTILGKAYDEAGVDLSGGQWQAFAIARAYLRDSQVLVLDEPTAALDARAEVAVYRQFRDVAHGRSVLLISHRLGSARLADRILVLAGGRIVEAGSHAELIGRDGRYATLYRVQASWYQ